jgi:hypothetical protein
MDEIDSKIINIIKVYKAQNVSQFAFKIALEDDKAKSRSLLQETVNHVIDSVLPALNVQCWSPKIYSSFNAKEKTTYFHAMLYCQIK